MSQLAPLSANPTVTFGSKNEGIPRRTPETGSPLSRKEGRCYSAMRLTPRVARGIGLRCPASPKPRVAIHRHPFDARVLPHSGVLRRCDVVRGWVTDASESPSNDYQAEFSANVMVWRNRGSTHALSRCLAAVQLTKGIVNTFLQSRAQ